MCSCLTLHGKQTTIPKSFRTLFSLRCTFTALIHCNTCTSHLTKGSALPDFCYWRVRQRLSFQEYQYPTTTTKMRYVSSTLLYAVYASGLLSRASAASGTTDDDEDTKPTVFNGIEVPPLPEVTGEKFNETVKGGYWFVKHYSYASFPLLRYRVQY